MACFSLLRTAAFAPLRHPSAFAPSRRLVRSSPHRPLPTRSPPATTAPRRNGLLGSWMEYLFGRKLEDEDVSGGANSSSSGSKSSKLKILKYPHPKLRADNADVVDFGEGLQKSASDLLEAMYESDDGVGLAAPQVGINLRLMVFNELGERSKPEKEMVLVNPVITAQSEETDVREEGCLSFPQIYGKVERHKWVEIEYQTVTGERLKQRLDGFPARVFQHEYDHLDKVRDGVGLELGLDLGLELGVQL